MASRAFNSVDGSFIPFFLFSLMIEGALRTETKGEKRGKRTKRGNEELETKQYHHTRSTEYGRRSTYRSKYIAAEKCQKYDRDQHIPLEDS